MSSFLQVQSASVSWHASVHLPDFGLLLNEQVHQVLTLLTLQNNDLNASLPQVRFAAKESLVLSNHNSRDPIEDAGSGAVRGW